MFELNKEVKLLCACGSENTHIKNVLCMDDKEKDDINLDIYYECENCKLISNLNFNQHKGNTFVKLMAIDKEECEREYKDLQTEDIKKTAQEAMEILNA